MSSVTRQSISVRLAFLSLLAFCGSSYAAERVALVIGNNAYAPQKVGGEIVSWDLKRIPIEDAKRVANVLESRLGFKVITGYDLGYGEMIDKIRDFKVAIKDARVALFYYSGHGAETKGENYLIPIDNPLSSPTDHTISLSDNIIEVMDADEKPLTKIILLDACRNDPYKGLGKGSESEGGLAVPKFSGGTYPDGMFIGFAASPGHKAALGKGPTSVYTTSLLKFLVQPGLEFYEVLRKAGAEVKQLTKKGQIPWHNSNADDVSLVLVPRDEERRSPSPTPTKQNFRPKEIVPRDEERRSPSPTPTKQNFRPKEKGLLEMAEAFEGDYFLEVNLAAIQSQDVVAADWLKGGVRVTVDRGKRRLHIRNAGNVTSSNLQLDVELEVKQGHWEEGWDISGTTSDSGFSDPKEEGNPQAKFFNVPVRIKSMGVTKIPVIVTLDYFARDSENVALRGKQFIEIQSPGKELLDPNQFSLILLRTD